MLTEINWYNNNSSIVDIGADGFLTATRKGSSEIFAYVDVRGRGKIVSTRVPVTVWEVDHILLTPRALEIELGKKEQIIAEVTSDDGERSTDVYLHWMHDADDQFIVRIGPHGYVTGNRIGRTSVIAGTSLSKDNGLFARIPVEVRVTPCTESLGKGGGFPKLLLTGRDIDPATGNIRQGDPDSPALWQEASDYVHNVWWLNLQSPEAAFAFEIRDANAILWRDFHSRIVMEMVIHVHMQHDFTRQGERESADYWANHRSVMDRHRVEIVSQMWEWLENYVEDGGDIDL